MEVLDEVEQIAEDFDEDHREAIMADVNERKEVLRDIDRRAAQDYKKLFKAMGDKNVFGSGRFLADGKTPVPAALTPDQERKIKRMKDKEEYDAAKLKYEMEQVKKYGESAVTKPKPKDPHLPTPNKPSLMSYAERARVRTITKSQAEELLNELLKAYSDEDFQSSVHADAKAVLYEYQPFLIRLKATAFVIQESILAKWGFDPTEEGLNEMNMCLHEHTMKDKGLRALADECTKMIHGGEDGMWGMDED